MRGRGLNWTVLTRLGSRLCSVWFAREGREKVCICYKEKIVR